MQRKVTVILVVIISFLSGCHTVTDLSNSKEKVITNRSDLEVVNYITNSELPFLKELNNTVEIIVDYDTEWFAFSGTKTLRIKDYKIISDILTMIGDSKIIAGDSKIDNMSGMAVKNNKMVFLSQDGIGQEIDFAFDDPAFAVGYIVVDDKKYALDYSFFRYMKDLTEYNNFDTNIDNQAGLLFEKYGWTIDYKVNTLKKKLPENLKHSAGEFPLKIYWAYNNELSKSIGLDFRSYLGKEIDVDIFRLREPLPDNMHPIMDARGIVMRADDKIIGAYIDAGRHESFACNLDRKSFFNVTGKEWGRWIGDFIDYTDELEIKLSGMEPEEIIKKYYDSINHNDRRMSYACLTRRNICNYLSANMDNNDLFNENFGMAYADGIGNVKSVEIIALKKMNGLDNEVGSIGYSVDIDIKYKKEITSISGKQPRFIYLIKESERSGWRIQGEGTGP